MVKKFKNKYRTTSLRVQGHDYSQNGAYFITICTKDKENYFGKIKNGKKILSDIGSMVNNEWEKTAEIRKNVILDEYVIMPNHFHAMIFINNNVETHCNASLQDDKKYKNKFGPQSNNLSSVVRGFKGVVTKQVHILSFDDFAWQSRFYDRIIRDDVELNKIREYIQINPKEWDNDKNNISNCIDL